MRIRSHPHNKQGDAPSIGSAAVAGVPATSGMDVAGRRIMARVLGKGRTFPASGQGVMGLRERDLRVPAFALGTHVAFGLALGLALRQGVNGGHN